MSGVLPPEMVVRVLNPIIKTGDFPVNQAAIKMLSKLVEKQTADSMEPHVGEVMPGLLKVSLAERNVDLTNLYLSLLAGLRQCGEQCQEGLRVLHSGPSPAGGGGLAPASPGLSEWLQDEAVVSLHQESSGSEQCRQSQVHSVLTTVPPARPGEIVTVQCLHQSAFAM